MKKMILIVLLAISLPFIVNSQTSGNLNFSVTPTSTGGFSPKHILAIWVETNSGTFVKTKIRYAVAQVSRLISWNTASAGNVIDAVTGATQNPYTTYTGTWNGTDVAGNTVSDGIYKLQFELAWGNNSSTQRSTYTITFTKSPTADHQTGNSTNFTNIVVDWVPGSGIEENSALNPNISIYPNPFSVNSTISFAVKKASPIYVSVYNLNGQLVKTLLNNYKTAGVYSLGWNATNNQNIKVSKGIYYVTFQIGNNVFSKKVLVND